MRRQIFLAASLLTAVPLVAAVPVSVVGHSSDPWERDLAHDPRSRGQCNGPLLTWINALYFRPVSGTALSAAERLLDRTAVRVLANEEARALLGLGDHSSDAVAQYFDARIAEQRALRRQVMEQRRGSWSLADQQDLDMMLAIRNGPRLARFRPYLVRGLAAAGLEGSFSMQVCGTSVVVMHIAQGQMPSRPDHRALVVFLERAPEDAFLYWSVSSPNQRY